VLFPDRRVFEAPEWPAGLRESMHEVYEGREKARMMHAPSEYPEKYPDPLKYQALGRVGAVLRKDATSTEHDSRTSQQGVVGVVDRK
jgi:hypothetical protein